MIGSPIHSLECQKWAVLAIGFLVLGAPYTRARPRDFLKMPASWFGQEESKRIARNILSYQTEPGGWPKNLSTTDKPYEGRLETLQPTYDNGATTDELRFLARSHVATRDLTVLSGFFRGLDYVLAGQYPNGGWPQHHSPGQGYHRHITFNDQAMVRLLEFIREVAEDDLYSFVDDARRKRSASAFDRGIGCILKCQIRIGDKLTVWCAQHDEIDFRPRPARTFELATLSGSESVGITRLLMSLPDPSPEVVKSVEAAVAWFRFARLTGLRVTTVQDSKGPNGLNKVVLVDPTAPPIWARFYDLHTQRPVFVDRDGIAKSRLEDIGYERRNGYAWYGSWPEKLLEVEFPEWRRRHRQLQPPR
jgi:PelA/Pel-15E family pectate lyase